MRLTVSVTQDHIDQGAPSEPEYCPVALALFEVLRVPEGTPALRLSVGSTQVELSRDWPDERAADVELPDEAQAFITDFDDTGAVEPFSFELDVPDEVLA